MQNDKIEQVCAVDDSEEMLIREVFARFGRAMYCANTLESEIANALLFVDWRANLRPPMTKESFEKSYDGYFVALKKLTMGALIGRLRKASQLTEELDARLQGCLEQRNRLTHHYFWERAADFVLVPDGPLMMIEECDAAKNLFHSTEQMLIEYLTPIRERLGMNDDDIDSIRTELLADAHHRVAQYKGLGDA